MAIRPISYALDLPDCMHCGTRITDTFNGGTFCSQSCDDAYMLHEHADIVNEAAEQAEIEAENERRADAPERWVK